MGPMDGGIEETKNLLKSADYRGEDTGTVNPHLHHVGAMGPIHYVSLELR